MSLSALLAALGVAVTNLDSGALPASLLAMDVGPWLCVFVILLPVFRRFQKRAVDPVLTGSMMLFATAVKSRSEEQASISQ